jgi:hypothetical protein
MKAYGEVNVRIDPHSAVGIVTGYGLGDRGVGVQGNLCSDRKDIPRHE